LVNFVEKEIFILNYKYGKIQVKNKIDNPKLLEEFFENLNYKVILHEKHHEALHLEFTLPPGVGRKRDNNMFTFGFM